MSAFFRSVFAPLMLLTALSACDSVSGSRNMASEDRQVGDFSQIGVSGSMDVTVTQGNTRTVTINAEDNIIPLIETETRDGALNIRFKQNTNIRNHRPIKIAVTTPVLEGVDLNGSGDVEVKSHFASPGSMRFSVSGSGDLSGSFNAPEIRIDLAGSGNVDMKGQTRDLAISIAGSGNCDTDELLSETADVNIAGSGNAEVHASRAIKANLLGSGGVRYKGDPTVNTSKLGSGSVIKL